MRMAGISSHKVSTVSRLGDWVVLTEWGRLGIFDHGGSLELVDAHGANDQRPRGWFAADKSQDDGAASQSVARVPSRISRQSEALSMH